MVIKIFFFFFFWWKSRFFRFDLLELGVYPDAENSMGPTTTRKKKIKINKINRTTIKIAKTITTGYQ
jgi:hypothetical protein